MVLSLHVICSMDNYQLNVIMTAVYKGLTPKKISITQKKPEVINVRIVSDVFEGISFTNRFKLLNDLLKSEHQTLFEEHLYIFEAFTTEEMRILRKSDDFEIPMPKKSYKLRTKELN